MIRRDNVQFVYTLRIDETALVPRSRFIYFLWSYQNSLSQIRGFFNVKRQWSIVVFEVINNYNSNNISIITNLVIL